MIDQIDKLTQEKPWGKFEQFAHNQTCTVKILLVNPGEQLSLQYHHHRDEFWRVISGTAEIVLGDEILSARAGDEFFIPRGTKHRIQTKDSATEILEISFGEFDEEDIVRLEDKYNRQTK
ncbi:phosphomannose isomerase type II C-terminal cupin domain [Patescibacteria group bacterium]